MADKKSFVFYKSWIPLFDGMTDEQAGALFKSLCNYQQGQDSRPADPLLGAIYDMITRQFAEDTAKYEETCQKRSEAGKSGGRPRKANESKCFSEKATETNSFFEKAKKADKDKDKEKDKDLKEKEKKEKVASAPRFVKPTVAQVSDYCRERANGINPESFVDFYESKGWRVGSQPMKDWKACVRTWEQRHKSDPRAAPSKNSFGNMMTRYTSDEISDLERVFLDN